MEARILKITNNNYIQIAKEDTIENRKVTKSISLSKWDDFSISAWTSDVCANHVTFTIDKDNVLYMPLFHLLNYDKELIIDDDDTKDNYAKYVVIKNVKGDIVVNFINVIDEYDFNKFNIFIKNIGFDLRSKIDCDSKDTKDRLNNLFNELMCLKNEANHQVTIEEYLIKNNKNIKTLKKDFKVKY